MRIRYSFLGLITMFLFTSCSPSGTPSKTEEKIDPGYTGFRNIGDESVIRDPSLWGELNTHDPSIFKDNGIYYAFSTDASYGNMHKTGVQIRKSADMITWQYVGAAFENFETDCAEAIQHAKIDVSKNEGLWAPDILKINDTYRLYFSASTFGSSRSCIALAEADNPEGPYTYRGIVIKTEANALTGPNAIDPAFIYDKDGRLFMSYGSFFGGIFIDEIDVETGFIKKDTQDPVRIAGSRGASVEGSYIVYIPESDYYYMFVSYGSLSSNYNIRVGRSKNATGPYLDANGMDMASLGLGNEERVGTKLIGGYTLLSDPGVTPSKGYMGPGHNSALIDGNDYFLVHHTRTYKLPDYWFAMNVRRFCINRFGWPVVAPNRYYGESIEPVTLPDGAYAFVEHLSDSNKDSHSSRKIELNAGQITGAVTGTYSMYEDYKIELIIDSVLYDGVAMKQYDWERQAEVYAFTAMSETGLCIWGCTQL